MSKFQNGPITANKVSFERYKTAVPETERGYWACHTFAM